MDIIYVGSLRYRQPFFAQLPRLVFGSADLQGIILPTIKILHVHMGSGASIGTLHMPEAGADKHERGMAVKERTNYLCTLPYLPVHLLNGVLLWIIV